MKRLIDIVMSAIGYAMVFTIVIAGKYIPPLGRWLARTGDAAKDPHP